ncbi:MAG TPA: protein kinase [Myxococcales bacterium]
MNCRNCGQTLDEASRFCKFCGGSVPPDPDEAAAPIKLGDLLENKWRIEKKIGQGGMGSVYFAQDLSLDRRVAIKILAPDLCNDHEFVARFEREAKGTANLEHPNVVLVYAVGQHFGRPFIVMKHLEGQSLARHLKQAKTGLPREQVVPVFAQLLAGLGFIHSKGYVHRDIKSGNIFLGPDGKTTILDFGILKDAKSTQGLTRVGVVMGTPHYLAPEQALGKTIDHRADLYAVGVLLYECLTGKPPFEADNARRIIEMHLRKAAPDPCDLVPDLPPAVGDVVRQALAKKPEERFQSADEFAQALKEAFAPPQTTAVLEQAEEEEEEEQYEEEEEQQEQEQEEEQLEEEPAEEPEPAQAAVPTRPTAPAYKKPSATVETPAAPAAEPAKKSGGGGFLSAVLILGILGGLGYGGYWYVKKEAARAEKADQNKPDLGLQPMGPGPGPGPGTGPANPVKPEGPKKVAPETNEEKAKKLMAEGLDYAKNKNYDFALQRYILAEELDPKSSTLQYYKALSHFALKEYKDANRSFGRVLENEPDHPDARMFLVRGYAAQKLWDEALGELKALSDRGYRELDVLESDEMLDELRKQPGWADVRRMMSGGGSAASPKTPKAPKGPRPTPTAETPGSDALVMGMTGELKVLVSPADAPPASVTVDGRPRGQAPLTLELSQGPHTVVIEKRGFKKLKQEVKVPMQGSFTLDAKMQPE